MILHTACRSVRCCVYHVITMLIPMFESLRNGRLVLGGWVCECGAVVSQPSVAATARAHSAKPVERVRFEFGCTRSQVCGGGCVHANEAVCVLSSASVFMMCPRVESLWAA